MKKIIIVSIAIALSLISMGQVHSQDAVEAIIEKQALAWETRDVSGIVADFAPDAKFIAAGFVFDGIEAIEKAATDYFRQFDNTKVTIKRTVVENNKGAVEWDWSDRNIKTGAISEAEDAIIFELQNDGKISYWREYIEKKDRSES